MFFSKGVSVSKDQVLLHVFFGDLFGKQYRKDVFQDWSSILSALGGILSLFLGFSFVTVLQLCFDFICKPCLK